ncbi:MAG: T9SS type A sorting domain-containing protein [Bacteroidales bacterium]|nr:T9SS type A sorting domain-containing protein [Bacteroidales bacterium]
MKTYISIIFVSLWLSATATWNSFGPEGISATAVCFNVDNMNSCVICTNTGIYLSDPQFTNWQYYNNSGLPAIGAAYLDGNKILTAMGGNGSYSDGVYAFDPTSGLFEPIDLFPDPNFVFHNYMTGKYYAGYYGGIKESNDGYIWTSIPYFSDKNMVCMDYYDDNIVVSEMDNLLNIFYSNDNGNTWNQAAAGSPIISDLKFDYYGKLFGIFPDESWSSGLWFSDDYGNTWDVEFYSINLTSVVIDAPGNIIVGWGENPNGQDEGIAIFDPGSGNLNFLNDGLPNLIVNDLCINPAMSAIVLFCCTENGVYMSYDYMTGFHNNISTEDPEITIYPNPVTDKIFIKTNNPSDVSEILLLTQNGEIIRELSSSKWLYECTISLETEDLASGIYFVSVKTGQGYFTKKIVLMH